MPFSLAVVTLRGKQVPVIGVVCMDQCMIDLTGMPEAQIGDEVITRGSPDGPQGYMWAETVSPRKISPGKDDAMNIKQRTEELYPELVQIRKTGYCLEKPQYRRKDIYEGLYQCRL